MKSLLRSLTLALFMLSITPTAQAWSWGSAWQSFASFFSNETDSTAVKVAKYGFASAIVLGTATIAYKYFYNSAKDKKKSKQSKKSESSQNSERSQVKQAQPVQLHSAPLKEEEAQQQQKGQAAQKQVSQSWVEMEHTRKRKAPVKKLNVQQSQQAEQQHQKVDAAKATIEARPRLSDLELALAEFPEQAKAFAEKSSVSFEEFNSAVEQFRALFQKQVGNQALWINQQTLKQDFKPYVQKVVVPENSEVAMWGDLHGSAHSLLRSLATFRENGYIDDSFNILKEDFYMFFLGDYVDRGRYGIEVIYTLLRLKLANPDKVFLVRGNHEDPSICIPFFCEISKKFPQFMENERYNALFAMYEYLPVALFLGTHNNPNYIQCCHGGVELGYNPAPLLNAKALPLANSKALTNCEWITELQRKNLFDQLNAKLKGDKLWDIARYDSVQLNKNFMLTAPGEPATLGFMWNDFNIDNPDNIIGLVSERRVTLGRPLVEAYINDTWLSKSPNKICRIIRAHQHNGTMLKVLLENHGIASHWDDLFYTLLSAPASSLGDLNHDSYVIVHAQKGWPVHHYKHEISASLTQQSAVTQSARPHTGAAIDLTSQQTFTIPINGKLVTLTLAQVLAIEDEPFTK